METKNYFKQADISEALMKEYAQRLEAAGFRVVDHSVIVHTPEEAARTNKLFDEVCAEFLGQRASGS